MNTSPFLGMRIARTGVIIGHYYEHGIYKSMTFGNLFEIVNTTNTLPKTFEKIPEFHGYCIVGDIICPDIFMR